MNILITNDDGINAPGIIALAKEISKEHKVIIVAPRIKKVRLVIQYLFIVRLKLKKNSLKA